MYYEAAPMEGLTTWLFRQTHHSVFGGVDRYFTPFFSPAPEHVMTPKELRDLCPENNDGVPVVPQVMARRAEEFLWAAQALKDMGYGQVNLNLGCPSGTVTAKGKGSGFLAHPQELDAFFDCVFSKTALPVSVKTRVGYWSTEEFPALLDIFKKYPVCELIVHPRTRMDFYKGEVDRQAFRAALDAMDCPVTYNGDLFTKEDCMDFARQFPAVETVMLGRGMMMDPALPRKLRGGGPATGDELRRFTETLYQGYRSAFGHPGAAAQRMKELWYYLICLFDGGEKYGKKMRRVKVPEEYERLEARIFRELPLRAAAGQMQEA